MRTLAVHFAVLLMLFATVSMPTVGQTFDGKGRRPFNELASIQVDLDGDRRVDTIKPRTYQTRRGRIQINWITFDIAYASGRKAKSIFSYKYGTDDVNYWVYALRPLRDLNKDGKLDLLFYSGDDTSDETVVLLSRGNRYRVKSRKISDSDDWLRSP